MAKILLAAGADPLIKNKHGETALEAADGSKTMRNQEVVDFIAAFIDGQRNKEDL